MDEMTKADIYSAKKDVKESSNFKPTFMNKGSVTQITMDGKTFDVVNKDVINTIIEQVRLLQKSNSEMKEVIRLQNAKINELKNSGDVTKKSLQKIVADINRNNWK